MEGTRARAENTGGEAATKAVVKVAAAVVMVVAAMEVVVKALAA